MGNIFLIGSIILAVWIFLIEYLQAAFYGKYVRDKDFLSVLTKEFQYGDSTRNKKNDTLQIGSFSRVVKHSAFPILCKYYIDGIGMVPRWTKIHKLICSAYK